MTYLAHIAGDGRKQTAAEHLNGTAERCALFAAPFGAEELGRLAGLSHDLGKYSMEFQRRLDNGPKVDHATAGAFACWRMGQPLAAFAAAGHHGGLPDGGTQGDSPDAGTFLGRMKRAERGGLPDCSPWTEEIALPSPAPPPCGTEPLSQIFFTRMLFSCLTDADFLDTEAFMDGSPRPEHPAPLDDLWERLQRHISGWFPPQGELNSRRCAVLEQCIRMGKTQPPGLFTLTVPTGGGKTVASLAFALAQARARARGLRRIIYVIPYTSIIEQTAQEFRTILGAENVLEHHSNAAYEIDAEATPETVRLAQAAENWDMPVVVTTAVQFFESLYANRPSQCRKLHNLAGSVILFDEAQLLPLPCLRPCIHAIAQLVQHYGASAVLCTATQPALGPLFAEFLPGRPAVELCPPELCPPESFRRVCFRQAGRLDWDTLSGQLQQHEQVLCVINSRKSAQEIFTRLSGEGNFHLSTLMYPAHRRAKLEEIRRRLKGGLPCRVISTSLIEAGVDVDFPAVFREEAGLDSILQAAGRCNREGKRPVSESIVTLFRGEAAPPPLFQTAIGAGRKVLEQYDDIASQEAIQAYFHMFLELNGAEAQDKYGILSKIDEDWFPFQSVAERFHMIDSPTRTVYIPLGAGAELIGRLRAGERSRALFRQLGQYGVSIYENHFAALDQAGDLERLEDGSAILATLSLYSEETGLSLEADCGKGLFI
ncbi:CRISPR-associated helicase Cas3' [Flavonifractor plautii]|uniref:CRISPR-associated helicase Cas3' n=1 Tax=Flavonifractor plautii TaxID=292800 RepID=UPI001D012BAA|nr:CRISPR-associated helicase Cas3' [Flavonifractor plautii]MCB5855814.1 CRISPR-associated helicase Cas3' [Flavonifractor plautii]